MIRFARWHRSQSGLKAKFYSKSSNFSHGQWNVNSRRRDIKVPLDFTLRKLVAILLLWSVKKISFFRTQVLGCKTLFTNSNTMDFSVISESDIDPGYMLLNNKRVRHIMQQIPISRNQI